MPSSSTISKGTGFGSYIETVKETQAFALEGNTTPPYNENERSGLWDLSSI